MPSRAAGPSGFQINKTAASRGISAAETSEEAWRLVVTGPSGTVRLSRAELLRTAPAQRGAAHRLRRGLVHLRPVVARRAAAGPRRRSSDTSRRGRRTSWWSPSSGAAPSAGPPCAPTRSRDPRSLLALDVNGEDLSPDHGYPARIIVPAAPGVLNTKWVARMTFGDL